MHPFALLALALAAPPQTVAYPGLTDNRREVVNFNIEPVRAIAQASDGTVYALNSHGSQIVHHMDLDAEPEEIFQTVLNPVSIALWGDDHIVVAGGGTHVLALHDRATGNILDVLQLPSEPADLVIHAPSDAAFIACQGANAVVRVDLTLFQISDPNPITDTYPIPAERPRFLSLDPGDTPESSDDRVYVTPFVSGNGSTTQFGSGQRAVIYDSYELPGWDLVPDRDLFSIGVGPGSSVTPIKKRVGTLLTAHGRHPGGKYWVLNVDSQNQFKNQTRTSEPALRGKFVENRVWIGDTLAPLEAPLTEQIDLDDEDGDGAYSAAESVAFPFGIAFAPGVNGKVYICSPLSDRVSIRKADGKFFGNIKLPDGSIPFDVEIDSVWNAFLFVHCFGTNKLLVYSIANPSLIATLDLGLDPTPAPIQRGRTIWYDAHRSKNARSSCNSCHPGGKSDFLGWQISDDPTDRKDVMVTQSLLGIEDTFPYHWRGERALIDFNGAFVDLLGGSAKLSEVPGGEFDDFQAFVFSLQPHANPREDISREIPFTDDRVDFDGSTLLGNAQAGLALFNSQPPDGGFNQMACVQCHVPQSGSKNDFINEVGTDIPSAQVLEIAHLRELTHKDQPAKTPVPGLTFARSGFGLAHSGFEPNIFRFIRDGDSFNLDDQQSAHVAAFVRRFDQGIAPAAHAGFMLDSTHNNSGKITSILEAQAALGWIDVVAFGRFLDPASQQSMVQRWLFDPSTGRYDCNDTNIFSQDIIFFKAEAAAGEAEMVFLGIPPGSGPRFALDVDNDGLIDSDEVVAHGTDPWLQDTDGDGEPDGYELANFGDPLDENVMSSDQDPPAGQVFLDFKTASLVKFHITADEDVRIESTLGPAGGPPPANSTPVFARAHTFVVQGLVPSTPATAPTGASQSSNLVRLFLIDRAGNSEMHQISVIAADMIHPVGADEKGSPLVLSSLSGTISTVGSSATVNATAQIQQRFFDANGVNQLAVEGQVAVFQVLKETTPNMYDIASLSTLTAALPTTTNTQFELEDLATGTVHVPDPAELPGPFVFAPASSATGAVSFNFTVTGVASGQLLRVRLIAILDPIPGTTGFVDTSLRRVTIPATAPEHRGLELEVP